MNKLDINKKKGKKTIRGEKTSTNNYCSTNKQTKSTNDTGHNEGWHRVARKQKSPKQQYVPNQKRDTGSAFVQKAQAEHK